MIKIKSVKKLFVFLILSFVLTAFMRAPTLKIALMKYKGGGDWYNDVNSLKNLAKFCNDNLGTNFDLEHAVVEPGSPDIFNYPFVYMTGHGNFTLDNQEAGNLRTYLAGGGFLFINDDYGIDPYARIAMKKVFPELDFVELPFSHPVYHEKFEFPNGLPKIHEHDNKTPRGYGLIFEGRLICFYNFECDLGDGWDDVHNDPRDVREKALQMGANIIQYVFSLKNEKGT
ncbi:MAG: DUF4159 domain-containing protein [Chitinophagaceae bacterium]|nr:DUF4159 domain-containing protein [Chitinophagaceae bacterium]